LPRYKKVADEQKNKGRKRKIAGIFMLLAGLLVAASDIGVTSSFWSEMSAYLLGLGAFLVPLALIICGIYLLAFSGRFSISRRVAAFVLLLICFLGLAHHLFTPAGQELDLYSFPEGGGFIGGIILWTLRKIAGTAGALIILVVLGLASVLLLSRISLQLLFVKIKNSFSGISKRENKKDVRRTEYSQPVKQKNITVSKENTFNPYRDGEFSEFTEGLEKPGAFKRIFGKTKKPSISEHLVNYRSEAYEDDAYNAYLQDDEQKQENTTQATQAFFAAPEEFAAEKPAVKQESKPVLEKFVKPEQDMAPAGSFLNPYRQKAIDFSDEEIPSEKIFAKPETKDDFTLNKPLNIADSADLVKEKSEEQAAVKTEEEAKSSKKDSAPGYKFPPLSLLNTPTVTKDHNLEEGIRHQCGILEQTLSDFKVRASVVAVTRGPSVTRFELEPAPGVKVSSVVNLADDIALKLAAPGVRIEAPIPGKAAIGIEVPNLKNDTVFFKEVVDCEAVKNSSGKLAIGLGKDIICIYVAIGQKASSVAQLKKTLETHGAMDYTIIVNATASDPAPLQYIAPYAGCAMGEYFMNKGRDVLIVYDDLSKHAIAYRAMSLLLERSPGREAYPGDVFYLHSRLLERAAHLSEEKGGGSITALPIIETQSGDVSAYIPTNVISITDGQLILETRLFFSGQRPAVNVGLSVSRVGGDAQTKAMKKAAKTIRLDLSQYREMESFTQFASDLDESTAKLLSYGQGLMRMLRQKQFHPYKQYEQVILLVAGLNHVFQEIVPEQLDAFIPALLQHFGETQGALCNAIEQTGQLSDDQQSQIIEIAKEFVQNYFSK